MLQIVLGNSIWPDKWSLVNVAIGYNYPLMQKRLIDSAKNFGAKLHAWMSYPPGARNHIESPYGFKIYAIRNAVDLGIQVVVWADSAVWVVQDPKPFFELVKQKGVVFLFGGDNLSKWVNDKSLREFGLNRDDLGNTPLISGSLFGFDFGSEVAKRFFDDWAKYEINDWFCEDDQLRPTIEFQQHRHDEAIASLLLIRHNIEAIYAYDYFQGQSSQVMFRASKGGF